jgi:hypothetical protein
VRICAAGIPDWPVVAAAIPIGRALLPVVWCLLSRPILTAHGLVRLLVGEAFEIWPVYWCILGITLLGWARR